MLRTTLIITAYTAFITVIIYLAAYSKLYDWWKSPLGRVMNLSLVAQAIVALGVVFHYGDADIGRIISIVGWGAFTVFIVLRLRLLLTSAKERRRDLEERYPGHSIPERYHEEEVKDIQEKT